MEIHKKYPYKCSLISMYISMYVCMYTFQVTFFSWLDNYILIRPKRKGMYLWVLGDWKDLELVGVGKVIIRIYCMEKFVYN